MINFPNFVVYEKETICSGHPVYADAETPANARICNIPEELCCGDSQFFTEKNCDGLLHKLMRIDEYNNSCD